MMNRMIKGLICLIAALLALGMLTAGAEMRQIGVVHMDYATNVRAEANSDAALAGKASAGAYYGCFGEEDGWYCIKLDDDTYGYVSEKRCTFYSTVAPVQHEAFPLEADAEKHFTAGDVVLFGTYEQDNDPDTAAEPIEWFVLDRNEETNQLLLVSRYAIERQHYHTTNTNATWETSGLRKWLNNTFINTAFSGEEQKLLVLADVTADQNPKEKTTSGADTQDKVFLLSMTEVEEYLTEEMRLCIPTAYVIVRNGYSDPQTSCCWWWLRTPGHNRMHTAYVNWRGEISGKGYGVISNKGAVRPAILIDLDGAE